MKFLPALAVLFAAGTAFAAPLPVVIDTDVGSEVDDVFALALAVASPELEVVGLTTVGRGSEIDPFVNLKDDRAWLAARFLTQAGAKPVPVAAGADPQPRMELDGEIQYRRHPAAIFNRTRKPVKESAVELTARLLKERDDLTLLCLGPLTNLARLLKDHPDAAKRIRRVVLMGGAVAVGYDGKPKPEPEWNVKTDIPAARAVFASGLPLVVVPLDATATVKLDAALRDRLFSARTPLTWQVQNLYELWDRETPTLFDPVAVAASFDEKFLAMKEMRLEVADDGMTVAKGGKPNARVATGVKAGEFASWYVERVRAVGAESLPKPPGNPSTLIDPGTFPTRVHAFEDYETDIEKRWWMSGRLETKDVPAPGGRACRAVLTQDFDDKQGDTKAMYRAVIFNPVPGPPVGPNTRLRFRYKLTGTDALRVQLYSLTNGYHRYLSVSGLDRGKWSVGCVDVTHVRRPDGTGGPLAADERIDDIQFYTDPRAELLIDDVTLYDAAAAGEARPFPERVLFTGWFDTGKQGKEWPGDFEIVPHDKPRAWRAAKSVPSPDGPPWLRVSLRGHRKLDAAAELTFRYRATAADAITAELFDSRRKQAVVQKAVKPAGNGWSQATVAFTPNAGDVADEIRFRIPAGGELLVDDVLLYTPGSAK